LLRVRFTGWHARFASVKGSRAHRRLSPVEQVRCIMSTLVVSRPHAADERQPALIAVVRPSETYFGQMETLQAEAYSCKLGEEGLLTADHFRQHLRVFPEGQFIAIDTATDRVVGMTVSMRVAFNPAQPLLDSWNATTNYG
jgi:hypothetical protein